MLFKSEPYILIHGFDLSYYPIEARVKYSFEFLLKPHPCNNYSTPYIMIYIPHYSGNLWYDMVEK